MLLFGPLLWRGVKSPKLKLDDTIPFATEILMTCANGFAIMIATSFSKTRWKIIRSGGLFMLKFLQLHKYFRESDGYQFKSKFGFRFGFVWSRSNEVLKLDWFFFFKVPAIFEKNEQNSLAVDFLLAVHLVSMFGFGWKNSFDHFPELIRVFFGISQGKLAMRFLCKS